VPTATATSTPEGTPGGRIQGRAWHDQDGDREAGQGEAGIAGIQVRLDRLTGQYTASPVEEPWGQATTGANGRYEFADLPSGTYVIRLAQYGSLEPTTPAWVAVNVAAGAVTYEVSFGLRQALPHLYLPLIRAR
jgi:hypothetical protein